MEREDAVFVAWTVLEIEGFLEEVDEAVSGVRRLLEEVEDRAWGGKSEEETEEERREREREEGRERGQTVDEKGGRKESYCFVAADSPLSSPPTTNASVAAALRAS